MNIFQEAPTLAQVAFYNEYMNNANNTEVADENDGSIIGEIMESTSSYQTAINILARIIFWKQKVVNKSNDFHESQKKAENKIFILYQNQSKDFIKKFSGDIYHKTWIDGVCVMRSRKTPNGYLYMKLVPPKSLLYNRITKFYHRKYEASVQYIQTQLIKDGYYCPGAVKRLKKIQRSCPRCRRRALRVDRPEMGMLHNKRLIPSKCFQFIQLDLAGPFQVQDYVNKRKSTRKAWIMVGICDYSRQASLTMVESLSKDHLLCSIQAHFHRYGKSQRIETDLGTNFSSAASHLDQPNTNEKGMNDTDVSFLKQELQSQGCTLVQRCAHSQWMTGSAEHMVKLMKQALKQYKSPMTAFTWNHVLEKTMYILNRRPIGVSSAGDVLTPADINPNFNGLDQKLDIDPNVGVIPRYYQQMLDYQKDFALKWEELYYRSVLRQKKWTDKVESLEIGDYVLILDHKNEYNYPTLAKVVHIQKDTAGENRYFSVSYKTNSGTWKTLIRTQHGLSLVLKNDETQSGERFDMCRADPPGNEIENEIENENLEPHSSDRAFKLKVKVQNIAPEIIDI